MESLNMMETERFVESSCRAEVCSGCLTRSVLGRRWRMSAFCLSWMTGILVPGSLSLLDAESRLGVIVFTRVSDAIRHHRA